MGSKVQIDDSKLNDNSLFFIDKTSGDSKFFSLNLLNHSPPRTPECELEEEDSDVDVIPNESLIGSPDRSTSSVQGEPRSTQVNYQSSNHSNVKDEATDDSDSDLKLRYDSEDSQELQDPVNGVESLVNKAKMLTLFRSFIKSTDRKEKPDSPKTSYRLSSKKNGPCLSSELETGLNLNEESYINMSIHNKSPTTKSKVKNSTADKIMSKSVITPDFEQKPSAPTKISRRKLKKLRRLEREKTKGSNWFGLEAPEVTDEMKNSLKIIKMRNALDPKRFYSKNDSEKLPKYFQMGKVVSSGADFYQRVPKKQQKSSIVEELLADAEQRKYNKRKYLEIQNNKSKQIGGLSRKKRKKKSKN